MNDELFVFAVGLLLAVLFRWGFTNLPKENWQILATVPRVKKAGGSWRGVNFTYYGFFNAAGYSWPLPCGSSFWARRPFRLPGWPPLASR